MPAGCSAALLVPLLLTPAPGFYPAAPALAAARAEECHRVGPVVAGVSPVPLSGRNLTEWGGGVGREGSGVMRGPRGLAGCQRFQRGGF